MSNWSRLQGKVSAGSKRQRHELDDSVSEEKQSKLKKHVVEPEKKFMALDCEMVGVGHAGKESCLARCSVVDYAGRVVYDSHVRAPERVTDFRTQYSGVRAKDLKSSSAVDFKECQTAVAKLLEDAILVGHALHNDLKVLLLTHPPRMTRDTAKYKPLMKTNARGKHKPRKLRDLAKEHLDRTIQTGEHGSVEDAQTALDLYKMFSTQWEAGLRSEVR